MQKAGITHLELVFTGGGFALSHSARLHVKWWISVARNILEKYDTDP
jgi:hypothetical protein